ncbi:hypothetical protein LIER_09230 [Lithospermum erythrorhizon]|uniref:DDE Tnp4 domain-containing protein n=1 Tax=Lithospermum erythrorhizon TaxID=34254 RepID=A0AAV3PET2_LITER
MLGSIDCMHWEWKNCPTQWSGQYAGRSVFDELTQGHGPEMNYTINGHEYDMGYYLADGIYPPWATFVKSIWAPIGIKRKYFAIVHEGLRKDVERAFGVLQAKFAIVRGLHSTSTNCLKLKNK